ncbi:MAG: amidohydrolase family protein [Acidobacteriota bacterium]|nr:amidohydrolase family protein [Acidobacteriota bacterium]
MLTILFSCLATAQVAVRGDIVYTMDGEPIRDGLVIAADGDIAFVGVFDAARVPDGVPLHQAAVVTPGLIDAHSVVGLAGVLNQGVLDGSSRVQDQDQLETSAPIQPELRAIDAYNAREELVGWLRSFGVTTLHTGHGPGALMSGQTMIVKTRGDTAEEAIVEPFAAIAITLGQSVSSNFESPGTRAKGVAMLRAKLLEAGRYRDKLADAQDDEPDRDLALEALVSLLEGDVKALVTAHTATQISTALRLQREFGFEMLLDGAAEAYLLIDEIEEADIDVVLHAPMMRAQGETRNASIETGARLRDAGIRFAYQSGYESYVPKTRVVLFEAAIAAANGLGFEDALAAVTRDAAAILGVGERVGSIAVGKDADLVLFDGDPFEYTSHVCVVIIDGETVSDECS